VTTIQKQLYAKATEPHITRIAICGIGGAGKTILARMVARQHKGIVWEFNAETETSLRASMKEFAYALGQSDEDRAKLKFIFTLTNVQEQSKQISIFVRNKLRKNPKWLMIFDNVESFSIIHPYLPTDPLVWGVGHVIITSRNSHFPSLEPNKIVKVDLLTKQEAIQLFSQTRWGQRFDDPPAQKELMLFLDKIPACPLDVVIAANFLRQSPELDYEQYLDRLNDNAFQLEHADRLIANSEYTQTRHDIISVSLQRLLGNPTFLQAMVLIGLLDAHNIPKHLLFKITDSASVERIIYELKKYSLIIEDAKLNGMAVFSMHQTIHSTLSNYIFKYLNPSTYEHLVETAIEVFEAYASDILDSGNNQSISAIISHTERMLSKNHLSKFLHSVLEITYVNLLSAVPAHSIKVIPLLERSLAYLESHPKKSRETSLRIARAASLLGDRYRSLSRFKEARKLLETSLNLYEELSPDSIDTAKTYGRLGTLYRTEGNHQKAQELFLKAVEIYNKYPTSYHPMDKLISLGLNSRDVGDYQQSLDYLTTNLNQVKDKNDPWRFWILSYMGTVYIDTGNYDKAWECFQQADHYFARAGEGQGEQVPYAWRLAYMGTTQALSGKPQEALLTLQKSFNVFASITAGRDMHGVCFKVVLPALGYAHFLQGNYEKAKEYFKESLMHLEKHYGKNHFQTGRVLCNLGLVAWKTNDFVESERLLKTAVDIFNTYEHTDVFYPLEGLSDLFYDRYLTAKKDTYSNEAASYKDKSKKYLLAALEVVKKNLPCDSGHLSRLNEKLKKRSF
jgi:tetratricopeptide (TPR) repeat protein